MSKPAELSISQKRKCDRLLQAAKNKTICVSHLPVFIIALAQWGGIASTSITCPFIKKVADRFLGSNSNIKGNPPQTYNEMIDKTGFVLCVFDAYLLTFLLFFVTKPE